MQKHKYNGKELDRMHGLNSYDYGARQHNPVTARWDRVDPLCEKYYNVSPYAYCANNPVRFIDPDGRETKEPEKWRKIGPVIPQSQFVGWGYNNIRNCLSLARKQIEKVSYTCGGGKDSSNMYPYNESKGVNKEQTEKAVDYIKNALEKGVPVVVGVDDEDGSPGNFDKTTDHFLVVVGMGNDENGNFQSI